MQLDLPECLPVDEINLCLVLSNLLENALEASLRTAPARRRIKLTAYLHGNSLALIQVENTYDGVIREKRWRLSVLQAKRRRRRTSVRPSHRRKNPAGVSTVTYQDGVFPRGIIRGERRGEGEREGANTEGGRGRWAEGDTGPRGGRGGPGQPRRGRPRVTERRRASPLRCGLPSLGGLPQNHKKAAEWLAVTPPGGCRCEGELF